MDSSLSLYIHVPFCVRRCPYCAFYSLEGVADTQLKSYSQLILRELSLRQPTRLAQRLQSIYLGGGTPSLLAPESVNQILSACRTLFPAHVSLEISMEVNPGTLTEASLLGYKNAGVTRLSLGVQALNEDRLSFLGRIHTRDQAEEAISMVKTAGFTSWSLDLMIGTPGETVASWEAEINQVVSAKPSSVSFYSLTVEEGTQLARRAGGGEKVHLPSEDTVDLLLYLAQRLQQAGYRHYEVSNWALPGHECRHNQHYWRRGSYLGLGPSAHSFDGCKRSWNVPDWQAYQQALEHNQPPPREAEILTPEEIREEWVYLSLRQDSGLDLREYTRCFGDAPPYWIAMFTNLAAKGLGSFNREVFQPSDRGLLLADEIAARILG